ncbi:MAG: hypothetical protein KA954_01330 [Chitinophagales bacterium]|nr:hypothetical protein [Chitinophagales bacterium]MBP9845824.1 hypothetical protein [Saprospiraceae bacterium]
MKKTNSDQKRAIKVALIVAFAILVIAALNRCNKPKPAPSPITTIEAAAKPVEDSLRKEVATLKDSILALKKTMITATVEKKVAQIKGSSTIVAREKAKEKKDTILVDALCDQLEDDYRGYVVTVTYEDSVQNEIIANLEDVVNSLDKDLELQKNKFSQAKISYDEQSILLGKATKELSKKTKRLNVAKFFNKVGVAAAAVAAFILLK